MKVISVLIVGLLLASFVGCMKSEEKTETAPATTEQPAAPAEQPAAPAEQAPAEQQQ